MSLRGLSRATWAWVAVCCFTAEPGAIVAFACDDVSSQSTAAGDKGSAGLPPPRTATALTSARTSKFTPTSAPSKNWDDARALAGLIDDYIAAKWDEKRVEPAAPADDAEFARRVWLDLAGRVPSVAETRAFLADSGPNKRERLVDRILGGREFVAHMTETWEALLLPEREDQQYYRFYMQGFRKWLRAKFDRDEGYDSLVRELLSVKITDQRNGLLYIYSDQEAPSPRIFYTLKQGKPENYAATTARLFLGLRIECAQCHDHPFASWRRDQFWSLAAFFGGISKQGKEDFDPIRERRGGGEIDIPGTERAVTASTLDGETPSWRYRDNGRVLLAKWVTSKDNPYFAKAAANRVWGMLFGVGVVDPVDNFGDDNPPSHPEVLDELANGFASHDFSLRFLFRTIVSTRAYQLSSASGSTQKLDVRLFARRSLKGLSGRQLYDSLAVATGFARVSDEMNNFDPNRDQFLMKFKAADDKPTERQMSILQALALMNGQVIATATTIESGATLTAVAAAPFLGTEERIETIFLAALGRPPRPEELESLATYVERGGPTSNPKRALADVFWTLLNSAEFLYNH